LELPGVFLRPEDIESMQNFWSYKSAREGITLREATEAEKGSSARLNANANSGYQKSGQVLKEDHPHT